MDRIHHFLLAVPSLRLRVKVRDSLLIVQLGVVPTALPSQLEVKIRTAIMLLLVVQVVASSIRSTLSGQVACTWLG